MVRTDYGVDMIVYTDNGIDRLWCRQIIVKTASGIDK